MALYDVNMPNGDLVEVRTDAGPEALDAIVQDYMANVATQKGPVPQKPVTGPTEAPSPMSEQEQEGPRWLQALGSGMVKGLHGLTGFSPLPFDLGRLTGVPQAVEAGLEAIPTIEPKSNTEKGIMRAGESIGATLPFLAVPGAGALTTLGTAAAGGTAAGTVAAMGGSEKLQAAAELATAIGPAGFGAATRRLLRGKDAKPIQEAVQAAETAGTTPTYSQALAGTPGARQQITKTTEAVLNKVPGAGGRLRKAYDKQVEQVSQRLDEMLLGLSEGTPEAAGVALQRGLGEDKGFLARFKGRAKELQQQLDSKIPTDTPVGVTNTRQVLADLAPKVQNNPKLEQFMTSPTMQALRDGIDEVGDLPYAALRDLRSNVGGKLATPSLISDVPRGELKQVYKALTTDMKEAAKVAGASREFERQAGHYRAGLKRIEDFIEPIMKKKVPEDAFQAVFPKSGSPSPTRLTRIKRSVKPAEWDAVVSATFAKMGKPRNSQTGEFMGDFNMETFLTNWNALGEKGRKVLMQGSRYANLQKDMESVANLASRSRVVKEALNNPPETARALMYSMGGFAFMYAPMYAGSFFGGSYALSRLMTSPKFVKWLAKEGGVAPEKVPAALGRLASAVQGDEEIEGDALAYTGHAMSIWEDIHGGR